MAMQNEKIIKKIFLKSQKRFVLYYLVFLVSPFLTNAKLTPAGLPEEPLADKILGLALWPAGIIGIAGFLGFWIGLIMIVFPNKRSKGKRFIFWSFLGIIFSVIIYHWHSSGSLCCGNPF